jgi:hypothetical protein
MDHRQHRDPGKNAQTPYLCRGARAAALRCQNRESETERDRPPEAGLVPRPPITQKPRHAHRRKNVPAIVRLHKRYSKAWPIVTPYCSTACRFGGWESDVSQEVSEAMKRRSRNQAVSARRPRYVGRSNMKRLVAKKAKGG